VGDPSSERVQVGVNGNPATEVPTTTSGSQGAPLNVGGDSEAGDQGCSKEGYSLCESIPQPDISGSQERWFSEVGDQPETSESVYPPTALQDGEFGIGQRPAEGRGLDGLNRSKGCLPLGDDMGRPPEILEIHMAGQPVRIPVPPLRSKQCTARVHQVTKTCPCKAAPSRDETDNVSRRHVGDGTEQGGIREPPRPDNIPFRAVGVCGQQGEVSTGTSPDMPLPGLHHRLQGNEDQALRGESNTDLNSLQESQGEGMHISKRISQANWQDDSNPTCSLSSTTVVQRTSTPEEPGIPQIPVIRLQSNIESRGPLGTGLVVDQGEFNEWEECINRGARPHHGDRCLNVGLGSSLPGLTDRRTLVSDRAEESHQLLGTPCSLVRVENIRQGQEEHSYPSQDGQQDGSVLCESNGGDSLPSVEQPSNPVMAVVLGEEPVHYSRISTRDRQLCSRRGVQSDPINCRVAITSTNFSADSRTPRQLQHRSICNSTQYPAEAVCELETRPRLCGGRCPTATLEQVAGLCLPSFLPSRQMYQEGQRRQSISDTGSPSLEVTTVVSSITGAVSGLSPVASTDTNTLVRPIRPVSPSNDNRAVTVSRLEAIRHRQQAEGISSEASQLLAAGWSRGTNSTYESAWRRWDSWCSERHIDPISCAIQPFLEFLTGLFKEGLQYRTINTIRSAISMTHNHIEGVPIGQHPLVSRLLKGVHNTRPPQPRYSSTWDVDIVIKYLQSLGENDSLSLKALTQKLALLMALVGANRVSELQALDLRYRTYKPEGVCFQLPTLGKKRKAGAPPKQFTFGAFPDDNRVCVMSCLRRYEAVTLEHRETNPGNPQLLFLSYIKPYKPVSSQRLATWLKEILRKAGIDTSVFKAHSVRGASSTAASMKGVLIEDILSTADWSTDSTFRRFYYRPMQSNNYAQILLQPRADQAHCP